MTNAVLKPECAESKETVQFDPEKVERFFQEVRSSQNLGLGIAGGAAAAITGAVIWAAITAVTGYQIGWMAVGVGFLVGLAVRHTGRGIDKSFGYTGAVLALAGCLAGNLLSICFMIAQEVNVPILQVISRLTPGICIEIMKDTFSPIDLLFYGIALYEGYKFSFRRIRGEELTNL